MRTSTRSYKIFKKKKKKRKHGERNRNLSSRSTRNPIHNEPKKMCSVQFSHSVVSDSLRPHELQHTRPPCPSPIPGVHQNSCASSQWCHPAISSSVIPFSSCPQTLPESGPFPMSQLFAQWLHFHFSLSCIGEGNGSPLQCSCLENPRNGGAWWAAVYGVAQSQTRLKRFSSSSSNSLHEVAKVLEFQL